MHRTPDPPENHRLKYWQRPGAMCVDSKEVIYRKELCCWSRPWHSLGMDVVFVFSVSIWTATKTLHNESKKAVGERLHADRRQRITGNRRTTHRPNLITDFQDQMLPQGSEDSEWKLVTAWRICEIPFCFKDCIFMKTATRTDVRAYSLVMVHWKSLSVPQKKLHSVELVR